MKGIKLAIFLVACLAFSTGFSNAQLPLNGVNTGSIGIPITFNLEWDCIHGDPVATAYWSFGSGANPPTATAPFIYDGVISASLSQTVTFWTPGDQTFTLTTVSAGKSAITDTFSIHIFDKSEGVENTSLPTLTISPNPTRGVVSIHGLPSTYRTISIINSLGETVMRLENPHLSDMTLDLSKLVPSTYYIRLSSENSVVTKKIIKQ